MPPAIGLLSVTLLRTARAAGTVSGRCNANEFI
jgi:hypothetical protein